MGGIRAKPDIKKHTIIKEGFGFSYAYSSMCGWRYFMEDAHIATSLTYIQNYLFGIFDGHGAEISHFVQKHFVKELEKNNNYKVKNYEQALKQTFFKMDQLLLTPTGKSQIIKIQKQLIQKGNAPKELKDSHAGCTANVILITPEFIYVANAGDSRSVALNTKEEIIQLSKDHKPNDPIEFARIKRAGGKVIDGRINGGINLSRSIGDFQYKGDKSLSLQNQIVTVNPDILKIKNEGINFIIMGCDGIWQVKSNEQMIKWINDRIDSKDYGKILQDLFDDQISKNPKINQNGLDNMSAILIKFIKHKK